MQNLVENVYSKRFLVIYLALIAILVVFFLPEKAPETPMAQKINASGRLPNPQHLPQFLLKTSKDGRIFTNADLLGKWTLWYFYDGECAPSCDAIWQVLESLALINSQGEGVALVVLDTLTAKDSLAEQQHQQVKVVQGAVEMNDLLGDFFTRQLEAPQTYLFLIDPLGRWHAQFKAPFTSATLQQAYLQFRLAYARQHED